MNRNKIGSSVKLVAAVIAVSALVFLPALAEAGDEGGVAAEIKALIKGASDYGRTHLKDQEGGISKDGSLQFWSSGGLMHWVAPDAPSSEYEYFGTTPKHLKVIELPGGEAAVAMYYSEGSFQVTGMPPVGHYMTRVMEVYVKEDGEWVNVAAHWSPVAAGSGTNQTSVD
jgi:hypothetical protein